MRLDTSIGWQRVNFVAMKSMARTLKHLTVEGQACAHAVRPRAHPHAGWFEDSDSR